MKYILLGAGTGLLFLIFSWVFFEIGLIKYEKVECNQWLENSKIYEGWYSTEWQREQCEQFNIILPE